MVIEGLVEIEGADRYSATLLIGGMFAPQLVGLRFAQCVRDHFYPEESVELISDFSDQKSREGKSGTCDKIAQLRTPDGPSSRDLTDMGETDSSS